MVAAGATESPESYREPCPDRCSDDDNRLVASSVVVASVVGRAFGVRRRRAEPGGRAAEDGRLRDEAAGELAGPAAVPDWVHQALVVANPAAAVGGARPGIYTPAVNGVEPWREAMIRWLTGRHVMGNTAVLVRQEGPTAAPASRPWSILTPSMCFRSASSCPRRISAIPRIKTCKSGPRCSMLEEQCDRRESGGIGQRRLDALQGAVLKRTRARCGALCGPQVAPPAPVLLLCRRIPFNPKRSELVDSTESVRRGPQRRAFARRARPAHPNARSGHRRRTQRRISQPRRLLHAARHRGRRRPLGAGVQSRWAGRPAGRSVRRQRLRTRIRRQIAHQGAAVARLSHVPQRSALAFLPAAAHGADRAGRAVVLAGQHLCPSFEQAGRGCFCRWCRDGFRDWLRKQWNVEQFAPPASPTRPPSTSSATPRKAQPTRIAKGRDAVLADPVLRAFIQYHYTSQLDRWRDNVAAAKRVARHPIIVCGNQWGRGGAGRSRWPCRRSATRWSWKRAAGR